MPASRHALDMPVERAAQFLAQFGSPRFTAAKPSEKVFERKAVDEALRFKFGNAPLDILHFPLRAGLDNRMLADGRGAGNAPTGGPTQSPVLS